MASIYEKKMRLVAAMYDRDAAGFATLPEEDELHSSVVDRVLSETIRQMPGERRVIDLGCGTGVRIPLLERNGIGGYTGIDFSEGMLAFARSQFPVHRFISGDISRIDEFVTDTYDGWFCVNVMLHIPAAVLRRTVPKLRSILRMGAIGQVHALSRPQMHSFKRRGGTDVISWSLDNLVRCFCEGGLFRRTEPTFRDSRESNPALTATFAAI